MKKYRNFDAAYKQQVVSELESGQRTLSQIAREDRISASLLQRWRKQIREGTLLRDRFTARERQQSKELDWYKKKVAEQAMEIDLLKKIDEYSRRTRRSNGFIVTGRSAEELRKDVRS
jgi:transposase-like protein